MKTTLIYIVAALLLGLGAGAALGYWEARPWASRLDVAGAKPAEASLVSHPTLIIGDTTYNFEKMESGAKQDHVWPIENKGGAPLTIDFVSHTCKCTSVKLNDASFEPGQGIVVPPGAKANIKLEWAAKVPAGPFRHGATFATNDPVRSRLELTVEGDIVESTTLEPSQLLFGSVPVGKMGRAELLVLAAVEPEVKILSHQVEDAKLADRVKIEIESVPTDQLPKPIEGPALAAGARVIATIEPTGDIGPFAGSLLLETNLKRAPHLVIPIHGVVQGDISIKGSGWIEALGLLRLPVVASAEGASARLQILTRGEHAGETELKVARVTPPELKATLGERKRAGDRLTTTSLLVEVPPGTRPIVRAGEDQGGEGEIVLSTNHPVTPEVRLRVQFTVKP